MALKHSYTLIAPFYDLLLEKTTGPIRNESIQQLGSLKGKKILITGIGSGLDIPFLPKNEDITGIDITPAMLKKAKKRAQHHQTNIQLDEGDAMNLPYPDEHFDIVLMHLILAVVPNSLQALKEAERVLKKGGTLVVFDKFLKPGEPAFIKRAINIFLRHIATNTDVIFEPLLEQTPTLQVLSDVPKLANGWFRRIECIKAK